MNIKYIFDLYDFNGNIIGTKYSVNWSEFSDFFKERVEALEIGESASEHFLTATRVS